MSSQNQNLTIAAAAAGVLAAGALAYKTYKRWNLGKAIYSSKWFSEFGSMWPGQAISIEIDEVLYHGKTDFQDVLVFKSKTYGNVLVLDGAIQATDRDEFAYQEMMVHPVLYAHPNPKKVLVIGGGDGGCLREIAKHKGVEEIHICELDAGVIAAAKKYMPGMAVGFSDPRVKVHIMDGFKFMAERQKEYDVVIVDSSDPVGPAEVLFQEPFYAAVAGALKDDGIACTQGECMWLHLDTIKEVVNFSKKHYKNIEYSQIVIPTYPSGTIGALILAKDAATVPSKPARVPTAEEQEKFQYYNAELHKASFVLPTFVQKYVQF